MLKSIRFLMTAAATASVFTAQVTQQTDVVLSKLKTSTAESRPAANSGLAEFKLLVNDRNFASYGFQSAEEIASATVGQPLVVFMVRLDLLRQYQPGTDPKALLSGGDKVLYPVLVGNQVRSSIIVDRGSGGWKAVAFGGPQLMRRLAQARDKAPARTPTMEVEILALSAHFLGELRSTRNGERLYLTPSADQPDVGLRAGRTDEASRIFAQLVPIARAYNGLPR